MLLPLFHSHATSIPPPTVEPVPTVFPKIEGADIAAVFVGKRVAGDFYDSVRVSPERVLFGLLDVAGRREDNRGILTAAQEIFRTFGTELFSRPDINESDAMTELSLRINRGLIEASKGVRPCPAFIACYHENFGTLCYYQCRTHARTSPRQHRNRRTRFDRPASGTFLPRHLRRSHRRPGERCRPAAGFSRSHQLPGPPRKVREKEFGLERVKQLLQAPLQHR